MIGTAGDWGDRLNPLTVRVVRQQLRSWAAIGVFLVLLLTGVLISLIAVSITEGHSSGRDLFLWLASGWALIAWVFLPTMLGNQLASEHRDQAWELVDLAGIDPWRLLFGWLSAAAAQQALIASAMAPFLVMAWLLRGIDLLLIVLTLIAVPVVALALSALALQAATMAKKGKGRGAIGIGLGGLLAWLMALSLLWSGMRFQGDIWLLDQLRRGDPSVWAFLLFLANLALLSATNALVLAASRLRHPAENRVTGPRLMAVVMVVNTVVWCAVLAFLDSYHWTRYLPLFAIVVILRAALLGIGAFADHWDLTPRQARDFSGPRWRRAAMHLLGPGTRAGRQLYLVLTGIGVIVAIVAIIFSHNTTAERTALSGVAIASYAAICLVLSDWATRSLLSRRVHRPGAQIGVTWLTGVAMAGIPMIVQLFIGESPLLAICSPITGMRLMSDTDGEFWPKALLLIAGASALFVTATTCYARVPTVRHLLPEDA